ncbi:MAG: ABC transporter permease [Prevotella sp.]|nr:ABC transporter permease [Prevotella sp.]
MNYELIGVTLLFLAVPLYLLCIYKVKLLPRTIRAILKMLIYLSVTGLCVNMVFAYNHWAVTSVWVVMMMALGAFLTVVKGRLTQRRFFLPTLAGVVVAVAVVGGLSMLALKSLAVPFDIRCIVPVVGILTGTLIETNGRALSTYYMGLAHHNQLYYYMLGNGATHGQALEHFAHRALERAALPCITNMALQVVGITPLLLWGMLLAGSDVLTAVCVQILMLAAMFCTSVLSVVITLLVARRFAFDAYLRLKQDNK